MQLKTMAAYHKNSKVFLLQTWLKHFLTSRQKMSMSMAVNVPISYQKHLMLLQQTQLKKILTSVASNMPENVPTSHWICCVLVKQTAGKCPNMLLEIFMLINVKTINLTPPLCPSSDLKAIIWTWSDSNVSLVCLTHEHWTHRLFADLPTCRSVDWAANVHAACLVHVCFMSTFIRRTRCPHTYSTYTRHMAVNLWMSFQWWQPVHHVAGHVFVLLH